MPVSYTHLDVYKRQLFAHSLIPRPLSSRSLHLSSIPLRLLFRCLPLRHSFSSLLPKGFQIITLAIHLSSATILSTHTFSLQYNWAHLFSPLLYFLFHRWWPCPSLRVYESASSSSLLVLFISPLQLLFMTQFSAPYITRDWHLDTEYDCFGMSCNMSYLLSLIHI